MNFDLTLIAWVAAVIAVLVFVPIALLSRRASNIRQREAQILQQAARATPKPLPQRGGNRTYAPAPSAKLPRPATVNYSGKTYKTQDGGNTYTNTVNSGDILLWAFIYSEVLSRDEAWHYDKPTFQETLDYEQKASAPEAKPTNNFLHDAQPAPVHHHHAVHQEAAPSPTPTSTSHSSGHTHHADTGGNTGGDGGGGGGTD